MIRNSLSVALGLVSALTISAFSADVQAQDGDLRVRYFSEPGYAGEGMPYRDCSLEEGEFDNFIDDTPASRDVAGDETAGLTREELLEQRERIYVLKQALIEQLGGLLGEMPADYPRRADVMFRMAEALKEIADADDLVARRDFTECIDNWYQCVSDTVCYEPMPDYAQAIEQYRAVARNHPSYDRIDEVVFKLGETLMENDAASEGIQFLTRLVNTYPDSTYIPDARILMADHYFDNDLLIAARQNYDEALTFPEASTYNYAIYKLGWIDINEYAFEDALSNFQTVVTNLDVQGNPQLDFRRQALNDMLKCYVEFDDGWIRARDYYEGYEGEDFMRQQLERLANLYDEKGKDEDRVAVYEYFINRFNEDGKVPQWAEATLASLTNIGDWDRYEGRARQFISMMDPNGPWAVRNVNDTRAQTNARGMTEGWMLAIINRNFQEADRIRNSQIDTSRELYVETRDDFVYFFARFPDTDEMYDQRFYYSELLYYKIAHDADDALPGCGPTHFLGEEACYETLFDAGQAYRAVVDMDPDQEAEHALDSALGYLQVADDFMIREFPDIDAPLPPPGQFDELYDRDQDGAVDVPIALTQAEQDYVDAVTFFANMFPDHEDIPAASWRAAKIYLFKGHLGEAAERFETIIAHHPTHRLAFDAALASFVCYNAVEDWPRIESVARRLVDVCADSEDEICNVDSLTGAIAYAMSNQAADLMDAGRELTINGDTRGGRALYLEAADKQVELYREFPDSEWSKDALYSAAATYEQARQVDTSLGLYNEFIVRFEEDERVPEAMYVMGLIHDSQASFSQAADWFERINTDHPEWEGDAGTVIDAVYNAARLREALSQYDQAIAMYDRYIELQQTNAADTTQRDVVLQLARIEEDRGNLDAAFERYQQVYDNYPSDQVRRLAATYSQAKIREEQGNDRAAADIFEQVVSQFGPGEALFNEGDLFDSWVIEPGANFTDEGERNSVRPFAVEAMFYEANELFVAAEVADLQFPAGDYRVLTRKMEARGAAVIAAQRSISTIYNAGDAQWAVAAYSRMGLLFYDFYSDIFEIPAPDYDECLDATNFNYDACDEAFDQYDEFLFTIGEPLRAKAELTWTEGRNVAEQNQIFTSWTLDLMVNLNDLDPSYQVGVSEGFDADNTGDAYLSTNYILDLTDKLEAFADFVEVVPGMEGQMDGAMLDGTMDGAVDGLTEGVEDAADDTMDDAVNDAEDVMDDTADDVGGALDDATDAAEDTMDETMTDDSSSEGGAQ